MTQISFNKTGRSSAVVNCCSFGIRKLYQMKIKRELTRRSFFRLFAVSGTALLAWVWYKLADNESDRYKQMYFRHEEAIPVGVSYFGKYYLYRDAKGVRAFSTRCTHAGCRLGESRNQVMQCGCHGSQFEAATGRALRGPAIRPLQELDCRFDAAAGQWVVKLNPTPGPPEKS